MRPVEANIRTSGHVETYAKAETDKFFSLPSLFQLGVRHWTIVRFVCAIDAHTSLP
jgi:hypothetical protein